MIWLLAALPAGYVLVLVLMTVFQRRLIYRPDKDRPNAAFAGAPGRPFDIMTADGLRLRCWYDAPPDGVRPVVLHLHGNGGHIGYRAGRLRTFGRFGWGTLLVEYRGYGGNPGMPTGNGLALDAQAALNALVQEGIRPERIVVWGESLGTAVAVRLASENRVAALVLEAPFPTLAAVVRTVYAWAPARLLLFDRFDALSRIVSIGCPLLVLAGGRDTIVPLRLSRRLFEAARQPKTMLVEPGAGHDGICTAEVYLAVRKFVEGAIPAV